MGISHSIIYSLLLSVITNNLYSGEKWAVTKPTPHSKLEKKLSPEELIKLQDEVEVEIDQQLKNQNAQSNPLAHKNTELILDDAPSDNYITALGYKFIENADWGAYLDQLIAALKKQIASAQKSYSDDIFAPENPYLPLKYLRIISDGINAGKLNNDWATLAPQLKELVKDVNKFIIDAPALPSGIQHPLEIITEWVKREPSWYSRNVLQRLRYLGLPISSNNQPNLGNFKGFTRRNL